ncbi:MAG: NAD(P)(+) transhydrogenase (Re/Si-specific) subunit alpha, partial [Rhodospirillaceae bacterium]
MKIAIPKERRAFETRVAASPDTVKKFVGLGCEVLVEKDAGLAASFTDEAFVAAGASIAKTPGALYKDADVVLKVQRPMTAEDGTDEIAQMKKGTAVFAMLSALTGKEYVGKLAEAGIDAF